MKNVLKDFVTTLVKAVYKYNNVYFNGFWKDLINNNLNSQYLITKLESSKSFALFQSFLNEKVYNAVVIAKRLKLYNIIHQNHNVISDVIRKLYPYRYHLLSIMKYVIFALKKIIKAKK